MKVGLMQEFKGKLLNIKTRIAMLSMAAFFMVMNSSFAAVGDFDTSAVTDVFVKIGIAIGVILAAVALTAATVMVTIMGWKFGRKMWGIVAK